MRWLEPIYSDTSLVTELGSAEAVDTGWHGVPVSSSTQPSLTARMLEDLGTEPEIIEAAATSWRWQRRFDKIIFSFGLPYVPDSIRTALAPGGRLIANAFGPMSAGLVLLEARSDGALSGRFTEDGGAFMPARREAGAVRAEPGERSGGSSGILVEDFDNYHLEFLLSARLPGLDLQYGTEKGRPVRRLLLPDGRWGEVTYRAGHGAAGSYQDQGLRAVVEETWTWWVAHAKPSWDQFGLTVGPDGQHALAPVSGRRLLGRTDRASRIDAPTPPCARRQGGGRPGRGPGCVSGAWDDSDVQLEDHLMYS